MTNPPIIEIESPLVIAVANQKGGTGKTTTTINLAVALRRLGMRTMVIDMDQQANATSGLGVDGDTAERTVYEVLHRDPKIRCGILDAAVETDYGVMVVPGTDALIEIEESGDDAGREWRLQKALTKLDRPYVVFLDCPPNLGRCTTIALTAADVVNEVNDRLTLGGVVAVEFAGGSQLHRDVRARLRERYGDHYLGEISKTVRVGEAKAQRRPLVLAHPGATASMDYFTVAQTLRRRIME